MLTPDNDLATSILHKALRTFRLRDAESELAHAVTDQLPAGDLLFAQRDPDPLPTGVIPNVGAPIATPQYEIALAWIPTGVPVTVHLYLNDTAVPGGSGTFQTGRVFFAIPPGMVQPQNKLTYALRFWQGSWKYQLWARSGSNKQRLATGNDPDPSASDDDIVIASVGWEP